MSSFKEIATYGGAAIGFSAAAAFIFYLSGEKISPTYPKKIIPPISIQVEPVEIKSTKEEPLETETVPIECNQQQESLTIKFMEEINKEPVEEMTRVPSLQDFIIEYNPEENDIPPYDYEHDQEWILLESTLSQ